MAERVVPWMRLSSENFAAANELYEGSRWRSSMSRSYYAAYARVTAEAIKSGHNMPARGNPGHQQLQNLLLHGLPKLAASHRGNCHAMLVALYWRRVMADYQPMFSVGQREAFDALGWMTSLFGSMQTAS